MSDVSVLSFPLSLDEFVGMVKSLKNSSFIVLDSAGELVYTHVEFCHYLGYTNSELYKMKADDWLTLRRHQALLKTRNGKRIRSSVVQIKVDLAKENKSLKIVLFRDVPGDKYSGLLKEFTGSFMRDINLGVMLINMDFELVDISDMACRILGMNRDEILNKRIDEIFASVPKEHQLVQRTLLDGLVVRNHAISWTNNSERYELLMDSSLLTDGHGRTVGAYVIFKDVSNLRSLEEQVQRSDRLAMIGQIAAGTAHEIRNPLTSIKGFLQILKNSLSEKGMDKELSYTEIMLDEINRINGLVSEFLLLSKPKDTVFYKVNISTVINEILPIIRNEAILHNVTVEYESKPSLPEIVADRELLKQVFLNICKNGIEAMGEGGTLTIREKVDREEGRVCVDIHDTGPGIPAFLIDKIFDPFFTTKEEGIGLGLSVCQRIIHDMGGVIRVKSKGFGTTFTISIPFAMS